MPDLDQNILRSVMSYQPLTGEFMHTRPISKGWWIPPGTVAGTRTKAGYIRIRVNGRFFFAHVLAWLWTHGVFPTGVIDHRDRNRSNNRIGNLRDTNKLVNAANREGAKRTTGHGWAGVHYRPRQGWVASIGVNRKTIWLGAYDDPEPAHIAYLVAKHEFHKEALA